MTINGDDRPQEISAPRLYLAPLKGLTNCVFRDVFARHFSGFDLAVAPFIPSKSDRKIKTKYVKDVWHENNLNLPVVPQIMSKNAADFVFLANYLYDLGHPTVNWNLGCPYPMVAKKGRGAGMLPQTGLIDKFLEEVLAGLKGHLSIKIRLGWSSSADIFRLVPVLERYPLEELIVHPRTGLQLYGGEVDLEALERLLPLLSCPLVYSGDLWTLADFKRVSGRLNTVKRWMLGRGALANPFLPAIIKSGQDDISDKIKRLQRFHDDLFAAYGQVLDSPRHALDKMKGLWSYLELSFEESSRAIKKIKKSRQIDEYLRQSRLFFETEAKLV